jgi:DNA-binding transcriptional regulator YiaG
MIDENDIKDIRRWMNKPWKKFAAWLGVNPATLWRWRRNGVPDGPATVLLERLKAEMIAEKNRSPWSRL